MLGRNSRNKEMFKGIKINGGKCNKATELSNPFTLKARGVRTGDI